MLAVKDHDALRRARLDAAAYDRLRQESGNEFFSAHVFALGGATPKGERVRAPLHPARPPPSRTRSQVPRPAAMGAFLWHYGLLGSPRFTAEQGHWLGRPGAGLRGCHWQARRHRDRARGRTRRRRGPRRDDALSGGCPGRGLR